MEAPTIPNIEIRNALFKFIVLFFRLNKILAIAAGMKKIKLVACAMCCSNPMNSVNNKIKKLETEIEKLENRVKFLEQELLKKEIYMDGVKAKSITSEIDSIKEDIENKTLEWDELASKI